MGYLSKQCKKIIEKALKSTMYPGLLPTGVDIAHDIRHFDPKLEIKLVFDIGANIGHTTTLFSKRFPDAQIYAFEPVSNSFSKLKENTIQNKNIHCFHQGFGSQKMDKLIYLQKCSTCNSLLEEFNNKNSNHIGEETIKIDTIDDFAGLHGINSIDLLKTDTEGFELEVLKGADKLLLQNKVMFIYVEAGFSSTNDRHIPLEVLKDYLKKRGFSLFGIYEQTHEWTGEPRLYFCNALFFSQHAYKNDS